MLSEEVFPGMKAAAILTLTILGLLTFVGFKHYNQCYSVEFPRPSGWTRIEARHYETEQGTEIAATMRDWISRVGEVGLDVVVKSKTQSPWSSMPPDPYVEAAQEALAERKGVSKIRTCRTARVDEVHWESLQWDYSAEGLLGRRRVGSPAPLAGYQFEPPSGLFQTPSTLCAA